MCVRLLLIDMENRLKISVAICTYNGAKYIEEQLRSILNQTVPVDEVCVGDDNSSDDTIKIIERIKEETGKDIRININNPNIGCNANFDKTINQCTGDIIFFSDQDDTWMPNKVETVVRYFENHPDKDVVFTDAEFMDEQGKEFTDRRMFDALSMKPSTIEQFCKSGLAMEIFLVHNRAYGCTMAMRRSFVGQYNIKDAQASNSADAFYDHIIALAAVCRNKLGVIPKPLIRYRLHKNQSVGIGGWLAKPPQTSDAYTVAHTMKFVRFVPDSLKERAIMVTDRYFYKKSTLYNNLLRYFYRYIKIYGLTLGIKVWYHDCINAIYRRGSFEW